MNLALSNAIMIVFLVCSGGVLLIGIFLSWQKHSPKNRNRIKRFEEIERDLKAQLLKISIQQIEALNGMLSSGVITEREYNMKFNDVIEQLTERDINPTVLFKIPRPERADRIDMLNDIMVKANQATEKNVISPSDYNKFINYALDEKKRQQGN